MGEAILARAGGKKEGVYVWRKYHIEVQETISELSSSSDQSLYLNSFTFGRNYTIEGSKYVLNGDLKTASAGLKDSMWIGNNYYAIVGTTGTGSYMYQLSDGSLWCPAGGYANFSYNKTFRLTEVEVDVEYVVSDKADAYPTDGSMHKDGFYYVSVTEAASKATA